MSSRSNEIGGSPKTGDAVGTPPPTPPLTPTPAPTPAKRKMSFPFQAFDAAAVLDGELAGDAGFDPLGLAKDRVSLFEFREAEIKHARLAMLAAVGWPISELYHD